MSDTEKNENELLENEIAEETSEAVNEAGKTAENETAENDANELGEELEEIRSKFQEILNETTETYLAGGDIQPCGEEKAEETQSEEISEDELCECCGEKRRDTSFGEDYPYCSECRELMQHYPLSFTGIIALIAVIILTGFSIFYVFGSNAELIDSALSAESAFNEGKVYTALESYSQLLQGYTPNENALTTPAIPKKVAARYAKAYASLLNYNYAYGTVQQFFTEKDLKNPAYKQLADYSVKNDCYSKIMEIINNAMQDEKNGPDDICALLENLKGTEGADDFLIDYYSYIVIQYFGETAQKQYEILTALAENYPDKWPVKYELCAISAKLGKTDEAEAYLKEVTKHNSEDGAIYAYLADAYRFSEKPDADKMLAAVADGEKADGESGYASIDLNRAKALAYLLKGDYDTAYDAAAEAYQSAYSSLYYGYSVNNLAQTLYTYQLCAHLKDDKDAYDSVTAILGYVSLEESKEIKKFVKGNISLEDIITNGEGDLA